MALEIISEPTGAPTGSFTPHADQKAYRSAFGLISTTNSDGGFISGHSLQNGIPTADGRRALKFTEFKGKDGKPNEVRFNGKVLREFICAAEDALAKDAYDAGLSNERLNGYVNPVNIKNSATTVGMQKETAVSEIQIPSTHQY